MKTSPQKKAEVLKPCWRAQKRFVVMTTEDYAIGVLDRTLGAFCKTGFRTFKTAQKHCDELNRKWAKGILSYGNAGREHRGS